jgi:hypothetical protein
MEKSPLRMPFFPHLTVTSNSEKRELLSKFLTLDSDDFLTYLYPLLSETQWDRVKEEYIQTLIIYGVYNKDEPINQLICDTATDTDNLNMIVQAEKGGILQVYTYGAPKDNRFIFVRVDEEEVKSISKELGGSAVVVRFLVI